MSKLVLRNIKKTLVPWNIQKNLKQIQITSADGCYLISDKKKIADFTSGSMAVNLGHNNKYILEAFNRINSKGYSYVPSHMSTYEREKLSDNIINLLNPSYNKVLFTNAGADANESAIHLVNEYFKINNIEGKNRFLSLNKSFHGGSSIGASLISGDDRNDVKKLFYKLPFETVIENPSFKDEGKKSLNMFEDEFKKQDVAGIIIEGSSGTAGCILYPSNYLIKLRKLCNDYNVKMICDEVMSGWGRTGIMFAHQKYNINPDIITTAKGITSGYAPLGAVILSKSMSEIYNSNPILLGLTYSGHVLSCAIANNCINLYTADDNKLVSSVEYKSNILNKKCNEMLNNYNMIKDFRLNGLLGCFEFSLTNNEVKHLGSYLLHNGIHCLTMRNCIFIAPPLVSNIEFIIDTLNKMDELFFKFQKY
jgi:taurine---2-oxoglutarate transaminase